jgi:hypothetical protein
MPFDIRTIQKLLGHIDLRTTKIYTHTVQSRTLKEAASPLDLDPSQVCFEKTSPNNSSALQPSGMG